MEIINLFINESGEYQVYISAPMSSELSGCSFTSSDIDEVFRFAKEKLEDYRPGYLEMIELEMLEDERIISLESISSSRVASLKKLKEKI